MIFSTLIRIYNELESVQDYSQLDTSSTWYGTVQYSTNIGNFHLEFRKNIKIMASQDMETSQLRIYLRNPNKALKIIFTVLRLSSNVCPGCSEILFSKSRPYSKLLIGPDTIPVHASISHNTCDRSIKLWQMSEEELFQFSLVDDFDFDLLEKVQEDVIDASHNVHQDERFSISFHNERYNELDFTVLDEYTVK